MVGVLATIRIKDGTAGEFEPVVRELMEKVAANEPGNVFYSFFKSRDEDNCYKVLEKYADDAALEAHGQTSHFKELGAKMGPFMAGPPEIQRLDDV